MRTILALLGLLLAMAQSTTAHAWNVAKSPHFIIYSKQDPASLRTYAEKLERFDGAMRALNPLPEGRPPVAPVTIFVLPDESDLHELVGSAYVSGIYRARMAGAFAFTIGASAKARKDAVAEAQTVLLHEYAHHFMLANFPANYPPWFTEGFAEFMSAARFEENGAISLGVPENNRGSELQALSYVSLRDMIAGNYFVSAVLEAKGWLLVHYLTFEPSRQGQLASFLAAINRDEAQLPAAQRIFGDLKVLDRELTAYLKRERLSYTSVGKAEIAPVSIAIETLSPAEEALMRVRIKTAYGVDRSSAKTLASDARRIVERYPEDREAQCLLARAEYWAERPDNIEAAADRMLAQDSASPCGTLFKGQALLMRAKAAELPATDKAWLDLRKWLSRANRAAPEDPWPMGLYYYSFRYAHAKPTANAIEALLGALDRAPQDDRLRYFATIEMLRTGQPDEARAIFRPYVGEAVGKAYSLAELHSSTIGSGTTIRRNWRMNSKRRSRTEGSCGQAPPAFGAATLANWRDRAPKSDSSWTRSYWVQSVQAGTAKAASRSSPSKPPRTRLAIFGPCC
jgi:hypothetical protein